MLRTGALTADCGNVTFGTVKAKPQVSARRSDSIRSDRPSATLANSKPRSRRSDAARSRKRLTNANGLVQYPGETPEEAAWYAKLKASLEQAGFKVTMLDPKRAIEWKKASRQKDRELIERGLATPAQIQRKNSLFPNAVRNVRIIDYGGLDEEA